MAVRQGTNTRQHFSGYHNGDAHVVVGMVTVAVAVRMLSGSVVRLLLLFTIGYCTCTYSSVRNFVVPVLDIMIAKHDPFCN